MEHKSAGQPTPMTRAHVRMHNKLTTTIDNLVAGARERLGIESVWSIETCVCCPQDLPQAEASIWWHAELFYARLYIRCSHVHPKTKRLQTIPTEIVSWLVYHELCELQTWRTTNFVNELAQTFVDECEVNPNYKDQRLHHLRNIQEKWQVVRNQEIEGRLVGLLGTRRPGYLEKDWVALQAEFIKQDQKLQQDFWQERKGNNVTTTIALDAGQKDDPDLGSGTLL